MIRFDDVPQEAQMDGEIPEMTPEDKEAVAELMKAVEESPLGDEFLKADENGSITLD